MPIQDHALEGMPDDESLLLEDRLWWVHGRKTIIREYLRRAGGHRPISNIMDIGCGSGGNLDVLHEFGRVIGVEPSETLARRARRRGIAEAVIQQDVMDLADYRGVELFTMFDVLEHLEDDMAFVAQLREKAAREHQLLVSVPACPLLYSDHDRILHHYRRYTRSTLRSTLEQGGYRVQHIGYFMFLLFPLALLARVKDMLLARLGRRITTVDVGDMPAILSVPLAATLRLEALLSRSVRLPIGLWLFALAEG